jgi:hypothetical protein
MFGLPEECIKYLKLESGENIPDISWLENNDKVLIELDDEYNNEGNFS